MKELTTRDLHDLLTAVERLNGRGDVTKRVLSAVAHLVPNDLIAIDRFADDQPQYLPSHWDNNPEMLTPEIEKTCAAVFERNPTDNPLIEAQVFGKDGSVLRLSDFGNQARLRRTAYYNEIMLPVGFDRQMSVMLAAGAGVRFSCAIQRKGPDFSERERQMLTLLAPHLSGAIAAERELRIREEENGRLAAALEAARAGSVTVAPDGRVLHITDSARSYIRQYFPDADGDLSELLRGSRSVRRAEATLFISASTDDTETGTTFVLREESHLSPGLLESLGLTPRQSEVLYWMIEGKTDEVIAELIGTSRRTVHKHVEHIFSRLGAESRTAAARLALSLLDQRGLL